MTEEDYKLISAECMERIKQIIRDLAELQGEGW